MAKKSHNTSTKPTLKVLKSIITELRENKSLHAVFGLGIVFTGLFILISSTSALFTWSKDFSYLNSGLSQILWDPNIELDNVFGKIGGAIGFFMTYKSLGWTFIIPVLWIIITGVKIAFNLKVRLSKLLRIGLLWSLLLSSLTAIISNIIENLFNDAWIGDIGYFIHSWGVNFLGQSGLWLFWIGIILGLFEDDVLLFW